MQRGLGLCSMHNALQNQRTTHVYALRNKAAEACCYLLESETLQLVFSCADFNVEICGGLFSNFNKYVYKYIASLEHLT